MALLVAGADGDPGYYYLELYYDTACFDADGDDYAGSQDPAFEPIFEVAGDCDDDCDDSDPAINPGVEEGRGLGNCTDGVDNDCDGLADADDPECTLPCPTSSTMPVSNGPIAFYLIPALALIFFSRRLLTK